MNPNFVLEWGEYPGHLGYCRSLLKEITCLIDQWDKSIGKYQIAKKEEEIINCENALYEVKDMIWNSCLMMFSKYNLQTKQRRGSQGVIMFSQPERTSTKMVNTNTEVIVHESNNVPIAFRQHEATHTVLVGNSPHQKIVKNVLFEWSVYINPQFHLCLVGTLPNEGRWETSPISARIGSTKVKTVSGTIYTLNGNMVLTEDAEIPDFVQEKFEHGFPTDWIAITAKWISILKEKTHGVSITTGGPMKNEEIGPPVRIRDIGVQRALTPSQVSQPNEKCLPPLPKDNNLRRDITSPNIIRKPAPGSTASRASPTLRPAQNQQNESSEEEEQQQPKERNVRKRVSAVVPRYSQRLLSKSLLDTTGVSEVDVSASKKVNTEKLMYLKDWGVDFESERGENLFLYGILVDEQGNALQKQYYSSAITRRVHADMVETVNGEHYRLVGPSISRSRDFDFGFPVHWQGLLQKLQRGGNVERKPSFKAPTRAQNRTKNTSSVSKRSIDCDSLQSRKGALLKRRKVMDEDQTQDQGRSQEGSMLSDEDKPKEMEPDKISVVKPTKTVIPLKKNCTVDKYVLGLATDDCQSEEDFNIF